MTMQVFNFEVVDHSWQECLERGLSQVTTHYLDRLNHSRVWLPGPEKIFNAFSLPLDKVNYVLFGESPYPRRESANGFAFWDASVEDLWSPSGLSKRVNRATSLRNILKMLLVAEGALNEKDTSQPAIASIDKTRFVQTNDALFSNFLQHGFLLLNASLVLQTSAPQKDAREWHPFIKELLNCLFEKRPNITFIMFGRIAKMLDGLMTEHHFKRFYAEHPYNHSFIQNQDVLAFFKPLHLLRNKS